MFKLQPGLATKPLIIQMFIMFLGCLLAAIPLWLSPNLFGQPDLSKECPDACHLDGSGDACVVQHQDLYYNCSLGHEALDSTKKTGFSIVDGRQKGGDCWRQNHQDDLKSGDAAHEYTWLCGRADAELKGEPTHLVWPVLVGYLVYGLFVGPILGYIFDFHNRVTISK